MRKFLKSFAYAFCGIAFCIRRERNMRIHITAFVYVMCFAVKFYRLSRAELAALILTSALVIALETVNTAIELLTDRKYPERRHLAKYAKDAAAGAVLIAAIGAAAVGVVLFWDVKIFAEIFKYFSGSIPALAVLIVSLVLSGFFIGVKGRTNE